MPLIKLNIYHSPDKSKLLTHFHYYRLHILNRKYMFKSDKVAKSFWANCNNELSNYYLQLNNVYIDTFRLYRLFQIQPNIYITQVWKKFESIDFWLKKCQRNTENFNAFLIKYINNVISDLQFILEKLDEVAVNTKYSYIMSEIRALISLLNSIHYNIRSFPEREYFFNDYCDKIIVKY